MHVCDHVDCLCPVCRLVFSVRPQGMGRDAKHAGAQKHDEMNTSTMSSRECVESLAQLGDFIRGS